MNTAFRVEKLDQKISIEKEKLERTNGYRFTGPARIALKPLLALGRNRAERGIKYLEKDRDRTVALGNRLARLDEQAATSRQVQWERLAGAIEKLDAKREAKKHTTDTMQVAQATPVARIDNPNDAISQATPEAVQQPEPEATVQTLPVDPDTAAFIASMLLNNPDQQ